MENLARKLTAPASILDNIDDTQQKQTKSIPSTEPIRLIYDCLGAGEKVEELPGRRARINRHTTIRVDEDKTNPNRKQVIYTSNKQTATVELTDIEKLIGKKKGATKIFTLALVKLCEQALLSGTLARNKLQIGVKELIEQGFYSTPQSARIGFDTAMDTLTSLKLRAEVHTGTKSEATAKAVEVLFTGYERESGNCYIYLNERINWAILASFYTVIPDYYPRLTSNGFDLLHLIFIFARQPQNRESLTQKGHFNVSLKSIQNALTLPNEEKTKNPERDIKAPIERAIEDIENHEQGRGLLKITPSVDGTEPIKEYLAGHIKVELAGEYSQKLIEISQEQHKQLEAKAKRKRKIEDNARTQALANALQGEINGYNEH